MKSKGVFVVDYMKLEVREHEIEEPAYGEVLVKTAACGLCCWDSWLYRGVNAPGPYPYIIGHEGAGVIEKVGAGVTRVKVGDKVFCAGGGNAMMSEYFTTCEESVVKLPEDTTDWAGVVYEPTVCAVNVLNRAQIAAGDHVVLIGAGYMGQLTLMGLTKASQAGRITVFELREDRRKMAETYGATAVYDPESEEGKAAIRAIQAEGGADICIDFGASDSGFHLADSMVKQAGKLVIGSFHRSDVVFNGSKWHLGGYNVINTSPMNDPHYLELVPRAYELIKRGIYHPETLVSHTARYDDLEELVTMFERSIDKQDDYMKGIVMF